MQAQFTGKDLILLGFKPARWFSDVLREAAERGLDETGLRDLAFVHASREERRIPLQDSLPFSRFIRPEGDDEGLNAEAVFATMTEVTKTPTVIAAHVMPDACPAGPLGTIPVGGVVSTRNAVHPGMHSSDVCCSMMTTDLGDVDPKLALDIAQNICHFGPGGHKQPVAELPGGFERRIVDNPFLGKGKAIDYARHHLLTSGDGNHFIFVGRSQKTGRTALVTHHGSRGFGAYLYKNGMDVADAFRRKHAPEVLKQNAWIELDSQNGADYMAALEIAHDWTILNHCALHDAVLARLGISGHDRLFSPHNFVFRDPIDGSVIHHAKGATPVDPALLLQRHETMIIPMNMAEPVLIVERTEQNTHGFAPHGAGRALSRTRFRQVNAGISDAELVARETKGIDARFWCGVPDPSELPSAYKSAASVQRDMEHFGLARIVDRIMPYGSIMAGDVEANAPWRSKKNRTR